jgi:hypothetical protein
MVGMGLGCGIHWASFRGQLLNLYSELGDVKKIFIRILVLPGGGKIHSDNSN